MKKKAKKSNVRLAEMARIRQERMDAGAYDGRFAPKVIPNKKKETEKNACRRKKF